MGAIVMVARGEARRRLGGLLLFAALVAIVGATVLAAAAGARRTSGALGEFLAETDTRDARAMAFTMGGPDDIDALSDALEEAPGVTGSAAAGFYASDAPTRFDFGVMADRQGEAFVDIDRPLLLEGRLPAPDAAEEVLLNERGAEVLGVGAGDELPLRFFTPQDCAALVEGRFVGFNSEPVPLRVVGVGRFAEELQGSALQANPAAIAGPAFATTYGDELCVTVVGVSLRLAPGADLAPIQAAARAALPDADPFVTRVEDEFVTTTSDAIDVAVTGLTAFVVVAGLAGLLAIGQAASRQVLPAPGTLAALAASGLDRRQRTLVFALPVAGAAIVGAVAAVVLAGAASPLFPVGVARATQQGASVDLDPLVLAAGGAFLVVVAGATAVGVAARRVRRRRTAADAGSSTVVTAATRAGAGPVAAFGLRLAYDRTPDRTAAPARTAIGGMAIAVVGLVGVAIMVQSLDEVRSSPADWGWTWSTRPDVDADLAPEGRSALAAEEGLAAAALLRYGAVDITGVAVQGFAIDDQLGATSFPITDGRPPVGPAEVAFGRTTMEDLDVGIGDVVPVDPPEGPVVELRVVGEAVLPTIDNPNPGDGAVFTPEGLDEVSRADNPQLLLTYEPGVDRSALEERLSERYPLTFSPGYAFPVEPGQLSNMADNQGLVVALGAFFALLGLAGLAHALVASARRQQSSFAVLRSLGLRRAQVRRTVVVQALGIVAAGVVVGLPVGLVVGRATWRAAVDGLGMVDRVVVPAAALLVLVSGVIAAALLVAVVPAWLSARRRPAVALRAE